MVSFDYTWGMKYYLIIFFFQVFFNIFKVLEIKYTYENQIRQLLINSVWINLVSLASVYFSIDRLLDGDMWVIPFYILGSVLGKWIAMKNFENIRGNIFRFIFKSQKDWHRIFIFMTALDFAPWVLGISIIAFVISYHIEKKRFK